MDRIKLETKRVSIEFPGVKALDDIDFEVTTGEIRAVVGANGAGKSTLMKVLAGANSNYTGEVFLNDKKVEIRTPVDAKNWEYRLFIRKWILHCILLYQWQRILSRTIWSWERAAIS